MSKITEYRPSYRPFEYPYFDKYFQAALGSVWRPEKVAMDKDILDFDIGITRQEQNIIIGILTGFTLAETHIGDYWIDVIRYLFPKHEIANMAAAHAFFERIHAHAYNFLADTLNINDHERLLGNSKAQVKLSYFENKPKTIESVAIFSGIEAISLFCSFAILLSFSQIGKFRGLSQIISWSALDEDLHADAGTNLYNIYVQEHGDTDIDIDEIYKGFDIIVDNEINFIDSIWDLKDYEKLNGILDYESLVNYLYLRANEQLGKLGLDSSRYQYDQAKALNVASWFHPTYKGYASADFFAEREEGGSYVAKPLQKFEEVDLLNLDYSLNLTLEV